MNDAKLIEVGQAFLTEHPVSTVLTGMQLLRWAEAHGSGSCLESDLLIDRVSLRLSAIRRHLNAAGASCDLPEANRFCVGFTDRSRTDFVVRNLRLPLATGEKRQRRLRPAPLLELRKDCCAFSTRQRAASAALTCRSAALTLGGMDTSSPPPVDPASPPAVDPASPPAVDPASPPAVDPASPPPFDPFAYQQWLDEILPLPEGARVRKVSVPALKKAEERLAKERGEPSRIIELSERRRGIRRRHALLLPEPEAPVRK